jgi:hypothetical protein
MKISYMDFTGLPQGVPDREVIFYIVTNKKQQKSLKICKIVY